MARQPVDPARKAQALQLADVHGAAEAARRTGLPAGTIRAWLSRERSGSAAAVPAAPAGAARARSAAGTIGGSVEELAQMGRRMVETAEHARRAAEKAMRAGKTTGAKDLGILAGVMLDQAGKLEAAAGRLEEADTRLTEEQGERMGEILRAFIEAIIGPRVIFNAGMRPLVEACAKAEHRGGPPYDVPEGVAEPVVNALRNRFRHEFERLALPAVEEQIKDCEVVE